MSPYEKIAADRLVPDVSQPGDLKAHADNLIKIQSADSESTLTDTEPPAFQNGAAKPKLDVYETDIEAGATHSRSSILMKEDPTCEVWPGHQAQKDMLKANRRKNAKGCNFMTRYSKSTRRIVHTVISLAVIGCIIGIGLGVNKAVHGGVWHAQQNSA